ncbi:MAG: hypothetical protein H3C60_14330 [Sphingomonadaceae bacterium]|nr:hypothetical protein [Sphingomonadaceae bacterium]
MSVSERKLHVKQIAAELGCSVETVRRYWREGKLMRFGAYKLDRTSPIRMPLSGVQRFKRECR